MQACNGYEGRTSMTDRRFFHTPIAIRVILRCIIYSMVPFVTHTCGFATQILVLCKKVVPYKLMLLSIILTYLEGTITALIFFTEPVVCAFARESWEKWCQMYVDEFRFAVNTERRRSSATLLSWGPHGAENKASTARMQPRPATTRNKEPTSSDIDGIDTEDLQVPNVPIKEDLYTTRIVPMRRVSINQVAISNDFDNRTHRRPRTGSIASSLTVSSNAIPANSELSPDTVDEVYIPYRYPMLARALHSMFMLFSRKKKKRCENEQPGIVFRDTDLEERHLDHPQMDALTRSSL
ncbi:hypothetical protein BX666DRAFT_836117 [Dichotomocladium elegans]|nr:hypothetical protein BX666DRAFT_836117 [Dichotomocladium elegans]